MSAAAARRGFTLLELLVVIGVVLALVAVGFPILRSVQARSRRSATAAVVGAVATAIAERRETTWTVREPAGLRMYPLWDVNRDGLIDGDPELENARTPPPSAAEAFSPAVVASGYRGLVATLKPTLPKGQVDATGRPLDAWKRPLRIRYDRAAYGGDGVGVWSAGPDGADDPPAARRDDIRSWEDHDD